MCGVDVDTDHFELSTSDDLKIYEDDYQFGFNFFLSAQDIKIPDIRKE